MAQERTFGAGLLHVKEVPQTGQRTVGLFQDPDGSSWVREPDGTETRLPAGGGGGGPPTGAAGGALAGTYPNPDLAAALAGAGLGFLANVVSVNVDGTTVEIVGDVVGVKDGGITPVKLSFDPATQAELDSLAAVVAALDAVTVKDGDAAGGDLAGTYPNPTLVAIGAATGPVGNGTTVPVVTIDAKGRVTALTSAAITGAPPSGAAGGVLSGTYPNPGFAVDMATQAELDALDTVAVKDGDAANGDLDGTYPNPTLDAIGAATGPLGGATVAPIVTIDTKGRVTALSSAAITGTPPGGAAGGVLSGTYPNPGFAADMATQAELDTVSATVVPAWRQAATRYYVAPAAALSSTALTLNTMYAYPMMIGRSQNFDRIGVEVTAFGAATAVMRLGLYADNGSGLPGALHLDAGTVATTTPNGQKEITIATTLTTGVWWLAGVTQVITCSVRCGNPLMSVPLVPFIAQPGNAHAAGLIITGIAGALPNPFGAPTGNSGVHPRVYLRAS